MSTKDKIVKVAGKLFAEHGFDGVSVRDIVRAAGVNLGAITYHFGGKEQLFEAVIIDKVRPMMEAARSIAKSKASPKRKLSAWLRSSAMQILNKDPSLRILFVENVRRARRLPERTREMIERRNEMTAGIIREGIADGSFRRCDVEKTTWLFFGLLTPYVLEPSTIGRRFRSGVYPKAFVDAIVDNALKVFFGGIEKARRNSGRGKTR